MSFDYIALATALAAMGGVFWGVYQYGKAQVTQRQAVLFELIKELNESPDLILAKQLLGYGHVKKPNDVWKHKGDLNYYSDHLKEILGKKQRVDDDDGEIEIRDSIDSFIVFLGKVGYSLKVGAIKRNEIIYFQYWIHKTIENDVLQGYINLEGNEFPLYQMLLKELTKSDILRKWRKSYPQLESEWVKPLTKLQKSQVRQLLIDDKSSGRY